MKKFAWLAFALASACMRHDGAGPNTGKLLAVSHIEEVALRKKSDIAFESLYGTWTGADPADSLSANLTYLIREIDASNNSVSGLRAIGGSSQSVTGELISANDSYIAMSFRFWDEKLEKICSQRLIFEQGVMKVFSPDEQHGLISQTAAILEKKPFRYDAKAMTDSMAYIAFERPKKVKLDVPEKRRKDTHPDKVIKYTRSSYPMTTNEVIGINASTQRLAESDLKNLKKADLELLRHAVYARHGYIFKTPSLSEFFMQFIWYTPVSANVEANLTPIEQQNLKLIRRFEKYADEYYEFFGR